MVAKDLDDHHGNSLVLAGQGQPAAVHLLAHVLNEHLGNVGQTVCYITPIDARPIERIRSLHNLIQDMQQKRVEMLVILGANPVYTAPVDSGFTESLESVPLRIHHSLYLDETSCLCHWHLPETHYLEAWSDARAYDGTASLVQPLIEPLYGGRSAHEVLALLANLQETPGRQIVREHWRQHAAAGHDGADFERFWQTALHNGVIPDTAFKPKPVKLKPDWEKHLRDGSLMAARPAPRREPVVEPEELAIVFLPDPTIYDGRFANNGWLQELPKPLTKLTWGNAALMSPATAEKIGVGAGSYAHGGEHGGYYMPVVELRCGDQVVSAPVWIMPGHADHAVSVYLGHGRDARGTRGRQPTSARRF